MARRFLAGVLAATACGGGASQSSGADAAADAFDRRALLRDLAEQVILPTYGTLDAEVRTMGDAVRAWCDALGSDDEAARRDEARTAWRAVMATWQAAELFRLGPSAMASVHDPIYSWPIVSSCAVDQDVVAVHDDPEGYDASTRLSNRRGLPALEYVLFATDLEHTCPPQAAPAGWDALSDATRQAARCAFAEAAVADLAAQTRGLLDAWSPDGGDYASVLATAGASGSPYADAHEAVNVVTDALFYVDSDVKDMKLAEVAGITTSSCATIGEPCLAELESPWSDHAKENIVANLRGYRMVFLGDGLAATPGIGFDDFLRALNAAELAETMEADLDAAIAAVEAIPGTLRDAVQAEPDAVLAAHAAIKRLTDVMKSQFLTVLALELPGKLQDDGD